ncbi:MAG: GNAT family N-acetyltransferase [Lachnospiraceae bacterium]|nr:GNAT family N-acetyltransferase [Lachnospiraceae bacterium]
MISKIDDTSRVKILFGNWQETMIWSCLQGVMGDIYTDNTEYPASAMAVLGDFCFLAGEPKEELTLFLPKDFIIMVPQNHRWADIIEKCYGKHAKKVTRYAMKKEPDLFKEEELQRAMVLPPEYSLKKIDEELFYLCREQEWSKDFVSQYVNYERYRRLGIGIVALKDNEIVAGASSYSSYENGIEIEIDTKQEYRRRGLAYACGAGLILECRKRNLYPSWDAQNLWSVALAEKLGYHFDYEYYAYEILK